MSIKNALRELLNNFDKIYDTHREIHDTAVRERLGKTISDHFELASPGDDFPLSSDYAMYTEEGSEEIYITSGAS